MTTQAVTSRSPRGRRLPALLFAMFGGQAAWAAHITVGMLLVPVACARDSVAVIHLVGVVTLAIAMTATLVAFRIWRTGSEQWRHGTGLAGRPGFMALAGMLLSGAGALLIMLEHYPVFVLNPCEWA